MDEARVEWIEQEVRRLTSEGGKMAAERIVLLMLELEGIAAADEDSDAAPEPSEPAELLVNPPVNGPEVVRQKLAAMVAVHPWMAREEVSEAVAKIVAENASAKSKRRKVIAIANRMTEALAPHVACKPGCSQCCHMNTVIYEHEAIRLAEVSGRKLARLPFRPLGVVHAEGLKFNGKPCPFLLDNRCSVYEDRPLLCRTHHSLRANADECSMEVPESEQVRAPMYDPDLLEVPYRAMSASYQPMEPCGNIAEFFPG